MKGGPNTTTTSSSSHEQDDNNNNNEYNNNNNENDNEENENEEEEFEQQEDQEYEERPKLAEGFFEIESVRKKRSRKGKLQYLIKWRGWPETANTWEPFENLMSCSDIIDAFEERLKSGRKGSSKKQKRKLEVVSQAPPAKKKKKHHQQQQQQQQERGSPAATYDVPPVKVKLIEEPLSHPSGDGPTSSKWAESSAKGTGTVRKLKRLNDNGSSVVSRQIEEVIESDELNVKLSELKGASPTDKEKIDELDVRIQDRSGEGISPSNGISNVNGQNSVWVCRSGGAKRRKSGAVKRFKQDSQPVVTNHTPDAIDRIASANGVVLEPVIQNFDQVGNCFGSVNTVDTSRSMYAITKIIKPIEYSISKLNDLRDILVTFLVLRSDGKEIMVDNRYLKANYPLLLINFYEQHIQYASE